MMLEKAVFNNKHIVFEVDKDGKRSFFPKNPTLSADKKLSYFDELMNLLADSFRVLPSHRYLTNERWSGNQFIPDSREFQAVDVRPVSQ